MYPYGNMVPQSKWAKVSCGNMVARANAPKFQKEMWLHGANGPKFLGETCWEHEPQGTCFPKELQPICVREPYFSKEFEPICPREVASPFSQGKLGKLGQVPFRM
jgi:hypothetical protein